MSKRWIELPERGTGFALRLIHWIGVRMGRPVGRALLYPITLYFLLTASGPRRGSRLYLSRLWRRTPRWWEVFRHIHCFAATILDRVYLLANQFERFDVEVRNGELLLRQVDAGQGCIMMGSHLGSFEILRVLGVSRRRFPLKVLMDVDHNPGITRFMAALNRQIAATVIPIGRPDTLLKAKESLEQGCLIGTLGDRVVADDKSVICRFLGDDARFPTGPWIMAAALQCPVILFFGLYRGGKRYEVIFEHFADRITLDRQSRPRDLQRWAERYAERLEHYARTAPYNWFNFYDFWGSPA